MLPGAVREILSPPHGCAEYLLQSRLGSLSHSVMAGSMYCLPEPPITLATTCPLDASAERLAVIDALGMVRRR